MLLAPAPQPFQPHARASAARRALWLLPLLLALVFVGLVAYWAEGNDAQEHAAFQQTLQADTQSVQAQLSARQDMERAKLSEVAQRLGEQPAAGDAALKALPEVVAGLDRLWNRLVWIGQDQQVLARAARQAALPGMASEGLHIQSSGQAEHLVAAVQDLQGRAAGQLLARYEITDLLQSTDLAWLNRRYQVEFLSELGEVIATTANPARVPQGARVDTPLPAFRDTTLRLTPYEALASWRSNPRTLALLAGVLLLGAAAAQLLRAEMARVARATARAQTEAAWRQSMEDSALVGLRARDPQGRILYVNKTLCDMVGYGREELVGLIPPLPFWPPEASDAMMERNRNTLAGDGAPGGYETRWQHRDGQLLDVMIFESPLVNAEGARIGWMGSIVDISERRALEDKERRHVETMAQHARLNDLGLIASELAHELNQPLTSIASYSAGLQLALRKRLPDASDLQAAVDAVDRNARKAGDIVHWIRQQTSPSAPQRTACDLNRVASESLQQRQRQIQRAQIQVQLQLARDLPPVPMDRIGIEQLIANLVRNAADALAQQPGERRIWLQTRWAPDAQDPCAPGMLEVQVRDNGAGLQGRTVDMLCATFYSTKDKGLGLGLGICRAIAESHGGSLRAQDAPEGGAAFSFTLPLGSPQPSTAPSP